MNGIKRNKSVITLAITIILSFSVVGCDSFSSKTDLEHVALAKDYLDNNDLKSGIIELKSALQKNPENSEARYLLGKLNLQTGNGPAAEKELRRALELGVAKESVIVLLTNALAIQNKYQAIIDEIKIPSNLNPLEKAKLFNFQGDAWLFKNKPKRAKTEYEQALKSNPESGAAKLGLAKLAFANKEVEESEQWLAKALQSSPKNSKIWLFQADIQRFKGEADKAKESYGQAIKLDSKNLMARYQRALLHIDKKDFELAQKDIQVLKKEIPKSFQYHYAQGLLAFFQKRFPEAETALNKAIKLNSNFAQAQLYRGVAHLEQNHLAQAEKDLARVQARLPNAIKPRQLLAQLFSQKNEYQAAKELLDPVIQFMPDDVFTLNLLGNIEFALGNKEQGTAYLQKLAELKPDNAGVHANLGLKMLKVGELKKGIEQLEQAGELAPDFAQGDAYIVMAHLQAKEYDKAEEVIDRIKAKHLKSPLVGNLTGILNQAKGDQPQAKKDFETVLVEFPGNATAANALANMALKEKDYVTVRKFYTDILAKHPKHLKTKLRLAALEALENKPKKMEAQLKEAIEDYPKALAPRLILSRYYTRYGQAGRAQTLLEEVRAQYGNNPQLLSALFDAQLIDRNVTRAFETAKKLAEVVPKSAQAQFLLAGAYQANRDVANMRLALNKSLVLDPKYIPARMATVKLLTLEGKHTAAQADLASLSEAFPESLAILELQGWVAARSNKPQEAIVAYQKLNSIQPSTKTIAALSDGYWAVGQKEESTKLLLKWIEENPKDSGVRYLLSGLYSVLGNNKEAIEQLKKIVELRPKSVLPLNDLAWQLRDEDPTKALDYAKKAHEQAPDSILVMDTLAMILLKKDRTARALSLLEKAATKSVNAPNIQYHLAIALVKNGQKEEAIRVLKALVPKKVRFSEKEEAKQLLDQITK